MTNEQYWQTLGESILLAPIAISVVILLPILIVSILSLPKLLPYIKSFLMRIKLIKTYEADEVKEILEANKAKIEYRAKLIFKLESSKITRLTTYPDGTTLSLCIKGKSKYGGKNDTQIADFIKLPTLTKSLSGNLHLAVWVKTDDMIWIHDYTAFLKFIEAIIAGKETL